MSMFSLVSLMSIVSPNTPKKEVKKEFDPRELGPKKVLLEWESNDRPFLKGMQGKFSRTLIIIGVVIGLILVVMQEYVLIILLASLIFISNVLSKANPQKIKHEISTHGFNYAGKMYYWHQLKHFFFANKNNEGILVIDTFEPLPGRLFVMFDQEDETKIKKAMIEYLTYLEEAPKSLFDKAYEAILDKFNLD